jgi:hypothetical protein
MKNPTQIQTDLLVGELAKKHLGLHTLEYRNNSNLDFHELSVSNIKAALEAAYRAGILTAQS